MKLQPLLEKKLKDDTLVYSELNSKKHGKVLKAETADGKAFVVHASLEDFDRFEDWIGKEADTKYKKTGKHIRTEEEGILPTIRIKVNSKSDETVIRPTGSEDSISSASF